MDKYTQEEREALNVYHYGCNYICEQTDGDQPGVWIINDLFEWVYVGE